MTNTVRMWRNRHERRAMREDRINRRSFQEQAYLKQLQAKIDYEQMRLEFEIGMAKKDAMERGHAKAMDF